MRSAPSRRPRLLLVGGGAALRRSGDGDRSARARSASRRSPRSAASRSSSSRPTSRRACSLASTPPRRPAGSRRSARRSCASACRRRTSAAGARPGDVRRGSPPFGMLRAAADFLDLESRAAAGPAAGQLARGPRREAGQERLGMLEAAMVAPAKARLAKAVGDRKDLAKPGRGDRAKAREGGATGSRRTSSRRS